MIIRRLREDENGKLDAVQSLAFSFSYDMEESDGHGLNSEVYGAFLDDGETLTATIFTPEYDSLYCGKPFKSVGIGGVASVPEYRRMGAVRAIFNEIFRMAPERGWAMSFLYPFSYNYYRQYGYERVMKRMRIKVPANVLAKFPRNTDAKMYIKNGPVPESDLLAVYNAYAANYDCMFYRSSARAYSAKPHKSQNLTYVWYDGETPAALATFRCQDGVMKIRELCYTSPDALRGILGFLRMFEGQVSEYKFEELPPDSELELLLGEYVDMEYSLDNGAMGRVLLPQLLLENSIYPEEFGHFRLQIDDPLSYNRGVYAVEYVRGEAQVIRMPFDSAYDLSLNVPALSRILLGGERFDARRAAYMDGVKINGNADDFFRAFGGRPNNLLEKF